jgi:hypothetical protein
MTRRSNFGRFLTAFAVAGFILGAAGCQSGGGANILKLGAKEKKAEPEPGKILASDLLGYCPKVSIREDTGFFNKYAKGGEDDPAQLIYQGSLTDVTRDCTRSGGILTMNIGVAGRVVPGPASAGGTITMPIRIAVTRGDEVLYSQLHNYQTTLGANATQFVLNDPNVQVPIPAERSLQVFAGFDEGPTKKKTAE